MRTAYMEQITHMRRMGESYRRIADTLGVPLNTVKSFCRRQNLTGNKGAVIYCACCGMEVTQAEHRKQKKYCSDACRMKYWNEHRQLISHKSRVTFRCLRCGREFTDYPSSGRKYCSHKCYIMDRFGGVTDE